MPVDGFLLGVALWTFVPFALLAGISFFMSAPSALLTLVALGTVEALAVMEFLGSSDGQAGLIFLPFWLVVAVLLAWGLDAIVRLLARQARGHRARRDT